jgi:hypothetical protein
MHGTQEQLRSYLDGTLDGATLERLDAHVSNCLPCALALADAGASAARWERRGLLGRLVRVEHREEPLVLAAPSPAPQRAVRRAA